MLAVTWCVADAMVVALDVTLVLLESTAFFCGNRSPVVLAVLDLIESLSRVSVSKTVDVKDVNVKVGPCGAIVVAGDQDTQIYSEVEDAAGGVV